MNELSISAHRCKRSFGFCIYRGVSGSDVDLTNEHIVSSHSKSIGSRHPP